MNFIHTVILALVEGLTEFLPISSTGHLILASRLLGLESSEFLKSFEIAIQSGAILAVIALYGRTLLLNVSVLKKVLVAFSPTAALGFLLYKVVKHTLLDSPEVVLWALFLGGIFLIVFERFKCRVGPEQASLDEVSYPKAFVIGVCQSLAIIPGVSRSAAGIIAGLALGLNRKTTVEFSFLLAIPTLLAATSLDLIKSSNQFSILQWQYLASGTFVSFVVGVLSIKFLLVFIQKHDFTLFGIYRIGLSLLFWNFVKP